MKYSLGLLCSKFCLIGLLVSIAHSQISPSLSSSSPQVHISLMAITCNISSSLASTNIQLHFKNSGTREAEATLTFPLPEGVSVSRYLLDIDNKLREAVPVPKAKARQVLEALENRQVDPGLIEKVEGNSFRTRIYPVPVGGLRKVVIGYDEEVPRDGSDYVYKLLSDYNKAIEDYEVTINVISRTKPTLPPDSELTQVRPQLDSTTYRYLFSHKNYTPKQTITLRIPIEGRPMVLTKRDSDSIYFYTTVDTAKIIKANPTSSTIPEKITIIWDNSLSMQLRNSKDETALLDEYFAGQSSQVSLYFLNYYFEQGGEYSVKNGDWSQLKAKLQSCTYDGATKYSLVKLPAKGTALFFTDGLSTLSNSTFEGEGCRLHLISSTTNADHSLLTYLANVNSGQYVNLKKTTPKQAASTLRSIPLRFQGIQKTPFVNEVYPLPGTPLKQGGFALSGIALKADLNLTLRFGPSSEQITAQVPFNLASSTETSMLPIDKVWAGQKIAALEPLYIQNKEEIEKTGRKYSIVTKGTSLIVLESVQDYLRYGIMPPQELREQFDALAKNQQRDLEVKKQNNWNRVEQSFKDIQQWWQTQEFPKKTEKGSRSSQYIISPPSGNIHPDVQNTAKILSSSSVSSLNLKEAQEAAPAPAPTPALEPTPSRSEASPQMSDQSEGGEKSKQKKSGQPSVSSPPADRPKSPEAGKEFSSNRPYMKSLEESSNKYQTYLELRELNKMNPTYYMDVATLILVSDRRLALKILSSIADLSLENHYLYKSLIYFFKQHGSFDDSLYTAGQVRQWREEEPQSHRDLALALELKGRFSEAAHQLIHALNCSFYSQMAAIFDGVEDVILFDVDRLSQLNGISIFDGLLEKKYYEKRIPVDLRVVMNWNQMGVDMDLHVVDPSGEECYYGHKTTAIGGKYFKDFTRGYGPQQFTLKKAQKGKYTIKTNFFGERRLTDSGPVTVHVEIFTRNSEGKLTTQYFTVTSYQVKEGNQIAVIDI